MIQVLESIGVGGPALAGAFFIQTG